MKGYVVPREKPDRCTNCLFMDRITYDCKLMYGDDYPDFETQYNNCPLIEVELVEQEEAIIPLNMLGGYLRKVTE